MKIAIIFLLAVLGAVSCFDDFITRSGDKLMEGPKEFRFISFNMPGLTWIEDPDPTHRPVEEFEQEDAIKTIAQVGGRVTRCYTFSIRKTKDEPDLKKHIYGIKKYDEDMFKRFDKMLELLNKHNVRVIVPFIDRWDWWGGINDFKKFRNALNFYEDPQVKQDFKDLIFDILNRVNTYTGVKYKDDKAILAWETGNELNPSTYEWTKEMAAYIKSVDKNHLVMDGRYGIELNSLNDPNIDIVSNHYYPDASGTYAERCRLDRKLSEGRKAFFAGEFGIAPTKMFSDLLDEVISDGTIGTMIWSMRFHNKNGGMLKHHEPGTNYHSYHWPGFPENNGNDEINVVNLMRDKAYKIQGKPIPPVPAPEVPSMLPTQTVHIINWRGSTGAKAYDIARATSPQGEWITVKADTSDCKQVETEGPLFDDKSAQQGRSYYYRVRAKNSAGISGWSNYIGPVKA